ncbi:unnamed protein product [marine sediment metagenome]|uniref:Uncharacterized protein n=1 Tax=marine sediment metagenome TaxID=412755 RepID=X1KYD2_9ZZZZ
MLEVSNIDTFYGKAQALWDVSLRVDEAKVITFTIVTLMPV